MTETYRKRKLIEVALPLDEINAACKADKGRNIGMIRNLHKWFAPMPLPAWRALLFAALIDDPEDDNRRVYLLDLIKRLVENGADLPERHSLDEARQLVMAQFGGEVPEILDPFCGGGSTLVEAQRLGLPTVGSDLNPVPVLISRTLTESLPRVAMERSMHTPERKGRGHSNSGSIAFGDMGTLRPRGVAGIQTDVLHYAKVVRQRAYEVLTSYFPAQNGECPIAWIWGRTATCTNPACGIETTLVSSWWLSRKRGEYVWMDPEVVNGRVEIRIVTARSGEAPAAPKVGRGASFTCVACASVISEDEVSKQGRTTGLGTRLLAVVSEVRGRRVYREPTATDVEAVHAVPEVLDLPDNVLVSDGGSRDRFGILSQSDLYTSASCSLSRRLLTSSETCATRSSPTAHLRTEPT